MSNVTNADVKLSYSNQLGHWRMADGMKPAQGPGDYPKLAIKYNEEGLIVFKILHPQDTKFAATDAFVPKAGKNNPADFAAQFTVTGQGTDTLTVKVENADTSKPGQPYKGGDYHYQLQFTNKGPLDPIISNGGCCYSNLQSTSFLIAAGVAIALLALWTWQVVAFRRTNPAGPSGPGNDKSAG